MTVAIASRDYWFKVVGMLQQNWALVDVGPGDASVVWFITDASGVFDELHFEAGLDPAAALRRNGFRRFLEEPAAGSLIRPPDPPFRRSPHPGGAIYSSGRFWQA